MEAKDFTLPLCMALGIYLTGSSVINLKVLCFMEREKLKMLSNKCNFQC